MYANDGLRHPLRDEARGLLLLITADLADEHHDLRLGIGLEPPQDVDERRADDRVAADADDRRVPQPELGQLVPDLVRERPGARDEPDATLAKDLRGDDSRIRLTRETGRPDSSAQSSVTPRAVSDANRRIMSWTGMCSVMQTIVPMPASADSSTAAAANLAGTKTRLVSAPVVSTASLTVSNTGIPSTS